METLILGGTALLGRAIAHVALDRGHAVTCLARGSSTVATGATFISADRHDEDGYGSAVRGWDVGEATPLLAPRALAKAGAQMGPSPVAWR